uniref:Aspartate/glutamate/uridylate kinase domain-containing protein n=1 Tax=Zea mays TaxID=4577 RepID=A0A804PPL9_MAIZE
LHGDWIQDPAIPVVTGFLGKGWKSGAVTTLGRGGSDLTATTIGKALGLREIQVWKDVDGVLTCDPNIYPHAKTVPYLTFEEATELAYFGAQVLHPQSMRPAREGDIPVRVKNSYNPKAPGTLISYYQTKGHG